MSGGSRSSAAPERVLLAAGTRTYTHAELFDPALQRLDEVPQALQRMRDTLTRFGYSSEPVLLDPDLPTLRQAIRDAVAAGPVALVYYTGHGIKPEHSRYLVLTADSQPGKKETALEARDLLYLTRGRDSPGNATERWPMVLIILDCCFSGAGAEEALLEALGTDVPVQLVASAGGLEYAREGRFAAAFTAALDRELTQPRTGSSQPFLSMDTLMGAVNDLLGPDQQARWVPGPVTGLLPFFPYPDHTPGVAGLSVAEQHWLTRLRGAPQTSSTGFYVTGVTGRVRALEDLAEWMRNPDRGNLAVVTGGPGCGKSTMLALPVLLADSDSRAALLDTAQEGSLVARAADLFDGMPVTGLHVRGLTLYQVAQRLAQVLGTSAESPAELIDTLQSNPQTKPRVIVVDAVDEAVDPRLLLSELLLPLAKQNALRVVVVARHYRLPKGTKTSLDIDLDSSRYLDPQALVDYIAGLLTAAHEPDVLTPYRDTDITFVAKVAEAIAARSTQAFPGGRHESFLIAQLLARAIRCRADVVDTTSPDWEGHLPSEIGAAFEEDLSQFGDRAQATRVMLAALAWAKGPGLPWETIWVPVAHALALTDNSPEAITDADVRRLLHEAGAFIVEDLGPGGRSVFRPFHDLLATYLRHEPARDRQDADSALRGAWHQRRQRVEQGLTEALVNTVPRGLHGRPDWSRCHPYVRSYLAAHAHDAGSDTFSDLLEDRDFLAIADPATLLPLLMSDLVWLSRLMPREMAMVELATIGPVLDVLIGMGGGADRFRDSIGRQDDSSMALASMVLQKTLEGVPGRSIFLELTRLAVTQNRRKNERLNRALDLLDPPNVARRQVWAATRHTVPAAAHASLKSLLLVPPTFVAATVYAKRALEGQYRQDTH